MKTSLEQDIADISKKRSPWLLLLILLAPLIIYALVIRVQGRKDDSGQDIKSYLKAVTACEGVEPEDLRRECAAMIGAVESTPEPERGDVCAAIENSELQTRCRKEIIRLVAASSPQNALKLCQKENEYDLDCVMLTGGYVALDALSRGDELCRKLPDEKAQAACYRGVAHKVGLVDRGAAKAVCDLLSEAPVREACYKGLGESILRDKGRDAAKAWCEKQAGDDNKACLQSLE